MIKTMKQHRREQVLAVRAAGPAVAKPNPLAEVRAAHKKAVAATKQQVKRKPGFQRTK